MTVSANPGRPVLGLRLGITGTRNLDASQCERLALQLRAVSLAVKNQMGELAVQKDICATYRRMPGATVECKLRFLSPLARGTDRLAAREALKLDYELHVPMPFAQSEYEKDFDTAEDLREFRSFLSQAGDNWLALDGEHGVTANRAYEAVGRYVVRHCEVLIAIWDGAVDGGRGGTAEIIRYAALTGVPVYWLHASKDCPPVWIADIQDLRLPKMELEDPDVALSQLLKLIIPPPPPVKRHRHGLLGWLSCIGQEDYVSPCEEHYAEQKRERRWI